MATYKRAFPTQTPQERQPCSASIHPLNSEQTLLRHTTCPPCCHMLLQKQRLGSDRPVLLWRQERRATEDSAHAAGHTQRHCCRPFTGYHRGMPGRVVGSRRMMRTASAPRLFCADAGNISRRSPLEGRTITSHSIGTCNVMQTHIEVTRTMPCNTSSERGESWREKGSGCGIPPRHRGLCFPFVCCLFRPKKAASLLRTVLPMRQDPGSRVRHS